MNKKTISIFAVALIVTGGVSFYGGMKYGQSKVPTRGDFSQNFQNLTPEQRQQRMLDGGSRLTGNRIPGGPNGAGFVNGDIIAKDDKSITVKGRDGGSKIIFISEKTQISESVLGKMEDLAVGKNVVVNGTTNPDGSITSQIIQVRLVEPNGSSTPPMGR